MVGPSGFFDAREQQAVVPSPVEDATEQYKRDRDPREKLFEFGRCVAHFAVDDHAVQFCTHLNGKGSWFLPFNQVCLLFIHPRASNWISLQSAGIMPA